MAPILANPGNGNSGNHGNNGNKDNSQKGNSQAEQRKNYGKPDHVDSDIGYNVARQYAVRYGLTGYKSQPPGIVKKSEPSSMLSQRPHYPGYEWQIVGDNLVLIALNTAIVTAVINGVFD